MTPQTPTMSETPVEHTPAAVGVGLVAAAAALYFIVKKIMQIRKRRNFPVDTVILHQIGRGPFAPSVSCYPLKLETFLRMANIPYENDFTHEMSSKKKTPWITYNGEDVADSQICIEYLTSMFGKDLNEHLTPKQRAAARAYLKMTEESLYWALCAMTFGDDLSMLRSMLPYKGFTGWLTCKFLQSRLRKQLWYQGMGRHSIAETIKMGRADLEALSTHLGNNKYFMGDVPCETDCAIFGMVAQCKWHQPGSPYEQMIKEDFKNLDEYCERMKNRFWPDWEECITAGNTRKAVK